MSSEVVEEEVIYEEVPEPRTIETGDSVKVKQVFDDSTIEAVSAAGYEVNYASENTKLLLMFFSCLFAVIAQFYPLKFPESRTLLGVCCAGYFILSSVIQFIISFVDKDTIVITKAHKETGVVLRIRTAFPRFQENFSLIIQSLDRSSPETVGKLYVGRYFTAKGEFDEAGYTRDFLKHVERFEQNKHQEFIYDHKSD